MVKYMIEHENINLSIYTKLCYNPMTATCLSKNEKLVKYLIGDGWDITMENIAG